MAVIRPFECVRPQAEKAERVAALPYDVYNREEACREVAREPLSFLKIDRAETQFDSSVDTYAPEVYAKAKELLENAIADGTFIKDSEQAYYIYELTMDGRVQTGLVACASIDDYESNVIKKHENTRADKELDRITHVDTCNAQTGPIFLAYRANAVINGEIDKAKKNSSSKSPATGASSAVLAGGVAAAGAGIAVLAAMKKKENTAVTSIDPKKATPEQLREYLGEVLPNFDRERVYVADIKKLISWYNILISNGITEFKSEPEAEEEVATDEK